MQAHKSAIVILIARITPGLSYLIPLFLLFQWLGLLGTLVPQIIIHLVVTVPIVIWIMIGYFETTPVELEEAALIDGATRWQVFRHVALPIAKPGIAVAFILAVIFSWNNFVFGIVLARPRDAHASGRGLQHDLLRSVELGSARRRRAARHPAGAAAHRVRAAPDRGWIDRWCGQRRLARRVHHGASVRLTLPLREIAHLLRRQEARVEAAQQQIELGGLLELLGGEDRGFQ